VKKRIIPVIIILSMLLSSFTVANARASDYLSSYNVTVSAMGNGVVRVYASVNATTPNMTKIGFPTVVLYEKSGTTWNTVAVYNSEYTSNSGSHSFKFDYSGKAGTQYYAYASFLAQDASGSDSRTLTSGSVTAT